MIIDVKKFKSWVIKTKAIFPVTLSEISLSLLQALLIYFLNDLDWEAWGRKK